MACVQRRSFSSIFSRLRSAFWQIGSNQFFEGRKNMPHAIVFEKNWPKNSKLNLKPPTLRSLTWKGRRDDWTPHGLQIRSGPHRETALHNNDNVTMQTNEMNQNTMNRCENERKWCNCFGCGKSTWPLWWLWRLLKRLYNMRPCCSSARRGN